MTKTENVLYIRHQMVWIRLEYNIDEQWNKRICGLVVLGIPQKSYRSVSFKSDTIRLRHTKNDFATVEHTDDFVSRCSITLDFQKF
jgi:hypothetical protein